LPIVAYALPPGSNINTYMVGPFGIGATLQTASLHSS
jgi:hypothetical protein